MKIGVLDSGIGGWSILYQLLEDAPGHEYIYLADQANAPYSERSLSEIIQFSKNNTRWLLKQDCELIVVACNTATVMALAELRRTWPEVPIVGTVPAIRPASVLTPLDSTIIVLATKNTVASAYLQNMLQPYRHETNFHLLGSTDLVQFIEQEDWSYVQKEVERLFSPFSHVDGVVLGCTHFPLIAPEIRSLVGDSLPFFTPNQGVSDRTLSIAGVENGTGSVRFHSTAGIDLQSLWQRLQSRLKDSAESARLQGR